MSQLSFDLSSTPPSTPDRRIDITLARLADIHDAMSDAERAALAEKDWWNSAVTVHRLRAMERGEEEVLGHPVKGLADIYDRIAQPGEHPVKALLRVFKAYLKD